MRENFLESRFSYALVIRADYKAIDQFKQYIAQHENIDVIFQKIGTQKFYITEKGEP